MEGSETFPSRLYSCALCENLNELTAPCCCQDNKEDIFEVTEPRLLKRCNLKQGDRLCRTHYDKLRRGMIFGAGRNTCCAPFHVGLPYRGRLRTVPRSWRHMFDTADVTQRYSPTLQICNQCYNIMLDLILNADKKDGEFDADLNRSAVTSPITKYTSPRKWMSSLSLHDQDGSTSGSTWSLKSSRTQVKSSSDLLSLYATQREKLGHPRFVPESVKRYFRSKHNLSAPNSPKTRNANTGFFHDNTSEKDSVSSPPLNSDCFSPPSLSAQVSNSSFDLPWSPLATDEGESKEKTWCSDQTDINRTRATISLTPMVSGLDSSNRLVCKVSIASFEEAGDPEGVSDDTSAVSNPLRSSSSKEINEDDTCQLLDFNDNKDEITTTQTTDLLNLSPEGRCSPSANKQPLKKNLSITVKSIMVPKPLDSDKAEETFSERCDDVGEVDNETAQESDQESISTDEESRSLSSLQDLSADGSETIDKLVSDPALSTPPPMLSQALLSFLQTTGQGSGFSQNDEVENLITFLGNLNKIHLQVYASTLAQSVVSFAVQDTQAVEKRKAEKENDQNAVARNTTDEKLQAALNNFRTCSFCGLNTQKSYINVVDFAQTQAEKVLKEALLTITQLKQEEAKTRELVEFTEPRVTLCTADYQEIGIHDLQHTTVLWFAKKKRYKTVFEVKVNSQMPRSVNGLSIAPQVVHKDVRDLKDVCVQTDDFLAHKYHGEEKESSALREKAGELNLVECTVDEVIPVERSFSTAFLDKCIEAEQPSHSLKLLRSSSLDSFFTVTCLVKTDQKSSDRGFVVTPLSKKDTKHESGVFSMLSTSEPQSPSSCDDKEDKIIGNLPVVSQHERSFSRDTVPLITSFDDTLVGKDLSSESDKSSSYDSDRSDLVTTPSFTAPFINGEIVRSETTDLTLEKHADVGALKEASAVNDFHVEVKGGRKKSSDSDNEFSLANETAMHSSPSEVKGDDAETSEEQKEKLSPGEESVDGEEERYQEPSVNRFNISQNESEKKPEETPEDESEKTAEKIEESSVTNQTASVMSTEISKKSSSADEDITEAVEKEKNDALPSGDDATTLRAEEEDHIQVLEEMRRKTTTEWYATDDVLRQRRSTQFMRALSGVALLRGQARKRNRQKQFRKTDVESEDEDVSDVICKAMEESTPKALRRKHRDESDEDRGRDHRKLVLRAVTIFGLFSILIYTGWRYWSHSD